MTDIADITQRLVELERARADGKREAYAEVLEEIDRLGEGANHLYVQAWKKVALGVTRLIGRVNKTII